MNSIRGDLAFEAHLSTQSQASGQNPRVSDPHEDFRRPQRFAASPPEGPASADPLKNGLTDQRFPKIYRLLRRSEFRRVYDEGQRRRAPLGTVFLRPNGLPHSRLGVTVPVRIGKAVLRNRLKRRVREIFRQRRSTLPAGWDILVNPREAMARVPFETLQRELLRLFPSQPPPRNATEGQPQC